MSNKTYVVDDKIVMTEPGKAALNAVVTDPLARTIARARKGNAVDRLAKLLEEESRWKRKQTIASNKLADVRSRLNQFAIEVAQQFAVDIAVAARKPGEKGEDK